MEFADHGTGALLVDHTIGFPLFVNRVLNINKLENKACTFTGLQLYRKLKDGAG